MHCYHAKCPGIYKPCVICNGAWDRRGTAFDTVCTHVCGWSSSVIVKSTHTPYGACGINKCPKAMGLQ